MFAFRKMLSKQFMEEMGDIDRETIKYKLDQEDFHEKFKEELRLQYKNSYEDLQSEYFKDPVEAKMKLMNASTLANFFQMYKTYYSIAMN